MKKQPKGKLSDPLRLLFLGTPEFAVPSLKSLVENGYEVQAVITQPDRPKGRGKKMLPSAIKRAAEDFGLEILQPKTASSPEFLEIVRLRTPDLLVVVAFGQILKKELLDLPRWGVLNIHASLLPRYRGAAPIQWAIFNNETKTGLTAMKMEEGLDSGPILIQEEISIHSNETAGQLHDRLAHMSGTLLVKTLKALAENRLREIPQDETLATYAPKIDRSMSLIRWEQSAQTISAQIRALDPWPGAHTQVFENKLKVFSSQAVDVNRVGRHPGKIIGISRDFLDVETGKGVVRVREMQLPGKKRLAANDFLRGFPIQKDAILG